MDLVLHPQAALNEALVIQFMLNWNGGQFAWTVQRTDWQNVTKRTICELTRNSSAEPINQISGGKTVWGQAPFTDGSGIHKLNDMIWDPIIWIKKYKICDLAPQVDQVHQVTWSTGMGLTPESVIRLLYEFDSETWEDNQKV